MVGRFAQAGCPRCVATGMHLARLRNVVSPSTRPPRRRFTQAVGTKTSSPFLDFDLASSGHRGRDDARGRRHGARAGLTRMSPRGAGAPCHDGRPAPPLIRPIVIPRAVAESTPRQRHQHTGSCDCAQHDGRLGRGGERRGGASRGRLVDAPPTSSVTTRSVGGVMRRSRQFRWRVMPPAAGLVAASMARRGQIKILKGRGSFCPNRLGEPAAWRACAWGDDVSEASQVHARRDAARAAGLREASTFISPAGLHQQGLAGNASNRRFIQGQAYRLQDTVESNEPPFRCANAPAVSFCSVSMTTPGTGFSLARQNTEPLVGALPGAAITTPS